MENIKQKVQERYTQVAEGASCCDSSCCNDVADKAEHLQGLGYSGDALGDLPEAAVAAGAGCGNPTAFAEMKEGETVLDLGSGGGIDVLLAAKQVGPTGHAIGVDMTPAMLETARKNAEKANATNVEFRKGEIENLPVDSDSVDLIISNCVINLSTDKDAVFAEAHRVLKPGGRMVVSDLVTVGDLGEDVKKSAEAWAGCIAGALDRDVYLEKIRNAGFSEVTVQEEKCYAVGMPIVSMNVRAVKASCC